ncbi:MAG: transposase [Deinococcota bacterium]
MSFLACFRHQSQRLWTQHYVRGLCSTAGRKSMQPLADVVAPGKDDHSQYFIVKSHLE